MRLMFNASTVEQNRADSSTLIKIISRKMNSIVDVEQIVRLR